MGRRNWAVDKIELTCDFGCRTAFACRDHNKKLHDRVVDGRAARLNDEDILLADTIEDLDARLAL